MMNTLEEYNLLMKQAGYSDLAELQQKIFKPDVAEMWMPAYLDHAAPGVKQRYIRNKHYRDAPTNRQYLVNYRKKRVQCACGMLVTKPNISSHKKSKRCIDRIKALSLVGITPGPLASALVSEQLVSQPQQPQPSHPAPSASLPVPL